MSAHDSSPLPVDRPALGKLSLLLFFFAAFALTFSVVLPLGEAADEQEHFALIRFIARQGRPPLSRAEQVAIGSKGDASPLYHSLVAWLTQHVDISTLPDLPDPRHNLKRAIPADRLPFKGLYHTEDEAFPWRGLVLAWHLARLASIPLGVITLIAVYLTGRAVFPRRPNLALAATLFAAFVPRLVINAAIVGDDNLVLPLIAWALYVMVRLAQGDTRRRTLVLAGGLIGLAAISKYHSLLLLPELTLLLLALAWRNRWGWRLGLQRWTLALLAFLLTAGWWFGYLLLRFNQVAQLGWVRGLLAPLGDPVLTGGAGRVLDPQTGIQLGYEAPLDWPAWIGLLFQTFWFRFGRGHVIDNPAINWGLGLLTLLALAGLVAALRRAWRNERRLDLAVLALHWLLYLGLVVTRYLSLPSRETAQGRHLYPALTAIALFLVLGWSELPQGWRRYGSLSRIDRAIALGVGGLMITFSAVTLPRFILPVYYPYLPITTAGPANAPIQHRLDVDLGNGMILRGYTLESPATGVGQAVPLTLYWQATAEIERDYLVRLCLLDAAGQPICRWGHPADGRYPTRAWEPGYVLRDQVYLPTPACLPAGRYELVLSVLPLRLDTANTALAEAAAPNSLSLGEVRLTEGGPTLPSDLEVWAGRSRYVQGDVPLPRLRQAVTLIDFKTAGAELVRLEDSSATQRWTELAPPLLYACPGGSLASTHSFIVDPGVRPEIYQPVLAGQTATDLRLLVSTRSRRFDPPPDIPVPLNASLGGQVELLGYGLDLSPRQPGEVIEIKTYWRAITVMGRRYVGSFHLLDNSMAMGGQIDHVLGDDFEYPNVLWAPGEVVDQTYALPVGRNTPPGLYTIEFGVYDNSSGDFEFLPATLPDGSEPVKQLRLGPVRVLDPAQTRPPDHPLRVELGGQIELVGYDLSSATLTAARPLALALHWQAVSPLPQDYTVFTQLLGPDGQVWAQQDNPPQGGRYPTTAWTPHERVVDRYELWLRAGAPPGEYRLLVGMYEPVTSRRLPALTSDGRPLPDNAIPLATLTVR
ncbi:MAG: glycosyltransferase family 39 protein [Chloroflexota bacterium]